VSRRPIYVETLIRAPLDEVWAKTQTPREHVRWDARFTSIEPLAEEGRFRYATRIGFGLEIEGLGESIAERQSADGAATSALRFWSDDAHSLIRSGSGYWRYVQTGDGVRFLTRYDYETRWGPLGALVDRLVFRPLLGRATAWSFDRLRIWLEDGVEPERSRRLARARRCLRRPPR
jgi:hypothetical protein